MKSREGDTSIGVDEEIRKSIRSLRALKDYSEENLVKDAERLAGYLWSVGSGLKTAQLRKIYGEVKRMDMEFKRTKFDKDRIVLLKPKLAYAANRKDEVKPLKKVLDECIDKVHDEADFKKFMSFFEAILAYYPR